MSVFSGPKILSTSTLSWVFDPATPKNLEVFSSNFYSNSNFSGGTGIPQENGSNPTNTIIQLPNPGTTPYVLEQSMGSQYTEYQIDLTTQLVASTTYCMSGWYAESSDYVCGDGSRMFHARAFSSSGAHNATGIGIGTTLITKVVNGITWRYCYELISTPSDYSNSFNWYVGYGNSTYTGKRYYTNLKLEKGTFPSMRNIVGDFSHAYSVNGTSYDSSGAITLDGTNDYVRIPFNNIFNVTSNPFTVIVWAKRNDSSTGYNGLISADSSGDNTWKIFKDTGEAYYKARVGNTVVNILPSAGGYTVGTWHQYAFSRSGSSGSATILTYQDGLQVNSYTGSITDPVSFSNDLVLGSYRLNDAVSGLYLMNQSFGPIYIYREALSAQNILDNFNAFKGRFGR
jgi:hypothetical protein